jgi:hypothetical protein
LIPFQAGSTRVAAVDRQLRDRDAFIQDIRERLLQAQVLMKKAHDEKHRQVEFTVGDWVWLRLNNRAAVSVRDNAQSKLSPKFYGPYEVIEKIGAVTYKLQLPPRARIHNAFHVAFLKKFDGAPPTSVLPLPPIVRGWAVPQSEQFVRACPTADS